MFARFPAPNKGEHKVHPYDARLPAPNEGEHEVHPYE